MTSKNFDFSKLEAIFVDIDGTLMQFSDHKPSKGSIESLSALRKRGIKIILASGRSFEAMGALTKGEFDAFVCSSGQKVILANGEVLRTVYIDNEDIGSLLNHIEVREEQKHSPWDFYFIAEGYVHCNHRSKRTVEICNALHFEHYPIASLDAIRKGKYLQLMFFGDGEAEKEVMRIFRNAKATRWHEGFIDILPAKGGKGDGVKAVCQALGIDPLHSMAFGDGENDISMFEELGFAIAMGNATKACKDAADYCTSDVEDAGIYQALLHFGLVDEGVYE